MSVKKEIRIEETGNVYLGTKIVGTLRKFCCGIDYRHKSIPNGLFSILKVEKSINNNNLELIKSLEVLSRLKPTKQRFHYNFSISLLKDAERLENYIKSIYE